MQKKNNIQLTIISFFSYLFIGSLVVVTGIIMNKIAESFKFSITQISMTFTFLNLGILIGILLNSYMITKLNIKKQIILSFFLIIISTILLFTCNNIILFAIIIFIYGLVSGITMSIGTFLITFLYKKNQRKSLLLITDSFFSISGIIFPLICTYILKNKISWYYIYIIISSIYIIIFLITLKTKFPLYLINNNQNKIQYILNKNIILIYLITFLYILGQLTFISWVPMYCIQEIHLNIIQTGKLISSFWTAYMIGMWIFSILITLFNLKKLITSLLFISNISIYLFNHIYNYQFLKYTIIILGFFSSAIYTSLITLISLETNPPSPKLINFMLISGTLGTSVTFLISSPIVKMYGIYSALILANIIYFIVFILLILLIYFKKKNIKKLN